MQLKVDWKSNKIEFLIFVQPKTHLWGGHKSPLGHSFLLWILKRFDYLKGSKHKTIWLCGVREFGRVKGIEGGRLSHWEAVAEKIKKTPFYLEPMMSVEIVFFHCPQVYSLATHEPSVRFSWFSVTYICSDVLLTPSFVLAAFFTYPQMSLWISEAQDHLSQLQGI